MIFAQTHCNSAPYSQLHLSKLLEYLFDRVPADTGCTSHWFLLYCCGNLLNNKASLLREGFQWFKELMIFLGGLCAHTSWSIPIKSVSVCVFVYIHVCVSGIWESGNLLLSSVFSQQGVRCHSSSCKALIWGCKKIQWFKGIRLLKNYNYIYMHAITHLVLAALATVWQAVI